VLDELERDAEPQRARGFSDSSAAGGIDDDVAGTTAAARPSWSKQVTHWRFHIETVAYANVVVSTATG
jgi:hypothetical protein